MGQLHVAVPLSPASIASPNTSPVQLYKTANTLGLGRCAVCSHVFSAGQAFFECYLCLNSTCSTKACSPRRHKIEHELSIIAVKLASPSSIEVPTCDLCTEQRLSSYYCDECDYSVCRECWRLKDAAQSHQHRAYTVKDAIRSSVTSARKSKITLEHKEVAATPPETPLEPNQIVESPHAIQRDSKDDLTSSEGKVADTMVALLDDKEVAPPLNLEQRVSEETEQTDTTPSTASQDEHKRSCIDKAGDILPQKDDKPLNKTADTSFPLTPPETPLADSLSNADEDLVSEVGSIELNIPSYFGSFDSDASSRKQLYQPSTASQLTPAPLKVKPVQRKSLALSAVIPPAAIDQIRRASVVPAFIPQPVRSLTSHPPMYAPSPTYPNQGPPQRASYPAPCYGPVPNQAPPVSSNGYVAAPYVHLPQNPQPAQAPIAVSNGYMAGPYVPLQNPQPFPISSQFPVATRTVSAPNINLQPPGTQGLYSSASYGQMPYRQAPQGQGSRPRGAQKKLTAYSDKTASKIKTLSNNPKLKKFLKSKQFKVGAIVGTKLILKVGNAVLNQTVGVDLGGGIDSLFDGFSGGDDIGTDSIITEDACVDGDGEVVVDSVVVEYPGGEEVFVDTTVVGDVSGDIFVSDTVVSDDVIGNNGVAQDFTGSTYVDQGYTSQVIPEETFVEQDYVLQDGTGNTYIEQDYMVQDAAGNTYMEQDITVQDAAGDTYTSQEIVAQDAAGDTFVSESSVVTDASGMNYAAESSVYENTAYDSYTADGFAAQNMTYGVY